jgi:hypothetical protein
MLRGFATRRSLYRVSGKAIIAAFLIASSAPACLALDGRIDLSNTAQAGGAGLTAYSTRTFQETYRVGERGRLFARWQFEADVNARRQWLDSSTGLSHLETVTPTFGLSYSSRSLRGGITGQASRRDDFPTGGVSRRDDYAQSEAWARAEAQWARLEAHLLEIRSWRSSPGTERRDTREHQQSLLAELRPLGNQELRYQFNRQDQEAPASDQETEYLSHDLRLRSQFGFAGERGRVAIDARVGTFDQRTTIAGDGATVLVPPIWGGVALDDTPEMQDLLEESPVAVVGLYDGDRDAATAVNIGDNASVVRQYGGDYRNLIFDFGDAEEFQRVVVYVDQLVRFPARLQWLVFVSDDPEGRDWGTALSPGQVTAVYEQLENNRQGWLVTFVAPVRHRYLKLVDVKLGETEPDLFVTEMEVFGPVAGSQDSELSSTLVRHRVEGDVGYNVVPTVKLTYALELQGKNYDRDGRDVDGQSHRYGLDWRPGAWWLGASYQTHRIVNDAGRNTNVRSQQLSLGNDRAGALRTRLSWSRVDDRSYTGQDLTNSYTGDLGWDLAPQLTLTQTVSHGVRDGREGTADSRSWVSVTDLHGVPWPTLDLLLRRADRWVTAPAGSGFTSYNDTEFGANWTPVTYVTLASQVSYEERDDAAWVVRNTLSWTPLPGGSVSLRLYVLDYQDTRSDYAQRGGGLNGVWRARSHLRFEGGAEWTVLTQDGERNTPQIWNARGTWTF